MILYSCTECGLPFTGDRMLLRRARLHDNLAGAYYDLAQWMDAQHSMDDS